MALSNAALIDLAVTSAEVQHGRRLERTPIGISAVGQVAVHVKRAKSREWSLEEEDFLRSALGHLDEEVIAARLGRSRTGVHLHWKRDMRLPAPSKAPGIVTAQGAAKMLGIDGHKTAAWVDVGLIPGRMMSGQRNIRLIDRRAFERWVCNPDNWVYFDPLAVREEKLRRLIRMRMMRWGDRWWTTRQVAAHHRVDVKDVTRYIKLKKLPAYRPAFSIGGRHPQRRWGPWFVLKSEATRPGLRFVRRGDDMCAVSPAAKRWIHRALRMGMNCVEIGRTMKVKAATVNYWVKRYFPALIPASGGQSDKRQKGRTG
jgi:hypothetical protein